MSKTIIILVIIGLLALAYPRYYPTFSWHQKLAVEVETPDGLYSGSSVVKASVYYTPTLGIPEASGPSRGLRGEATIVELPDQRYLFVLLGEPVSMAQDSFKASILGSVDARLSGLKTIFYPQLIKLRERVPLAPGRYPLFVTFTDINDPTTVQQVDPQDLAASFGAGYSLKSITLEITDEPVTWGRVEEVLGGNFFRKWGLIHREALKRGLNDPYFGSFLSRLSRGHFIEGVR